ncbi:PAS domain S-box protein [Thermodesulfobacteriota bacterium]
MITETRDFLQHLPPESLSRLFKRQLRGAFDRSIASAIMWSFALFSLWVGSLNFIQLWGISASILYLILINPPMLLVLKGISTKKAYELFSLAVNQLEIIGYTAIIYFCGGVEATYLTLIYAALIAYVGIAAPRRHSYIIAGLCSVTYGLMVALDHLDYLPHMGIFSEEALPLSDQSLIVSVVVALLFVVAYLSGTAASLLRAKRDMLSQKNLEMAQANLKLEQEIDDRKQAEVALRVSEEKYRGILESIEDGYYEVDLEGNFEFFNESMCRILGYSQKELPGLNIRNNMDEENAEIVLGAFTKVFRTGTAGREVDLKLLRKDGTICFIAISISLIRDPGGQAVGFRGIVRDTTERKIAEEEKEKLKDRLQRAQKMEAIGTLAGGVAHDLNNLLSGVTTYPEFLLSDMPETSPLRKPIMRIQKTGEKAAAVVQDLVILARGGVVIAEPINLNEIIEDYLDSPEHFKIQELNPHVRLETRLDPSLSNIMGSPNHLFKTIMNLVSNAVEAIHENGDIHIYTSNSYIDEPVKGYDTVKDGEYAELTVQDTGAGLSDNDIERIFEPFYTKKILGRRGTGLGMAVVWGTVKDHKGYIDIESSEGKGTKITLYFPATKKRTEKEKSQIRLQDYNGNGESVLVVDDVQEQREIAVSILTRLKYSVASVSSGEEAVSYVKEHPVDLIILDMIMDPGMDGLDTFKQILEINPGQKAVIASGFSETERVKEAKRLGVGRYIRKPYTLENIAFAVREELNKQPDEALISNK